MERGSGLKVKRAQEMKTKVDELCQLCVYMPKNLPSSAYSAEDYEMLKGKDCAYDFSPASEECKQTRKTSCSIVDMEGITNKKIAE